MTYSSTKSSATMDDLPNELLIKTFEYLKIKDLTQCSLVCKRFKSLCSDVKVPELIICNTTENIKDFWFCTNKKFNHLDAIDVTTFNSYRSILRLDKLRRLYFEGSQSEYDRLKVNDLTQVEQLKINMKDEAGEEIHINLLYVKMIEIDTSSHKFIITTPKLEKLKCNKFDVINLTYSNTIKHLETDLYTEPLHILKNLQTLQVAFIDSSISCLDTFSSFPKLTTLLCTGHTGWVPSEIGNLIEYKRKHQMSKPKIYFLSVELHDNKIIDEFHYLRDDFLFQMNHYNLLAETVLRNCITLKPIIYSQLMDSMNGRVPDDFYKKYFSVRSIWVVETVEKQEHLFRFLKKFDFLNVLWLCSDSLNQSYLNRLNELDQLTSLRVIAASNSLDPNSGEKSTLNFDFLLKMQRLKKFDTTIESINFFNLTIKLLTQLKYFESITFFYEKNYVWIRKDWPLLQDYKITCYRYVKDKLDFNGLVREMDAVRKCPPIRD